MTIQTDVAPLAASRGVVRLPLGRERMRAPALLEHEAQPEQHEPVRFGELKPEPSVDDQERSPEILIRCPSPSRSSERQSASGLSIAARSSCVGQNSRIAFRSRLHCEVLRSLEGDRNLTPSFPPLTVFTLLKHL
jgi:hypothetical protein